jgi:hypothetical protein
MAGQRSGQQRREQAAECPHELVQLKV